MNISKQSVITLVMGLLFSWHIGQAKKGDSESRRKAKSLYQKMQDGGESLPDSDVFLKAFEGYQKLLAEGKCKKEVLAIVDFRISSTKKRLWVIDMAAGKTLHHTLVSHGQQTGYEYAKNFSNIPSSHQSSIGFYVTDQTYYGKHGLSLRLQGVEKGFNHKAYQRAIVMHGANYVSADFIQRHGRLGRSYGCPAVPQGEHKPIIQALKDQACLLIYYPDQKYERESTLIGHLENERFTQADG